MEKKSKVLFGVQCCGPFKRDKAQNTKLFDNIMILDTDYGDITIQYQNDDQYKNTLDLLNISDILPNILNLKNLKITWET